MEKLTHIKEGINSATTQADPLQGKQNGANGTTSHTQADYLHVFDSRTWKIHNIPVLDGFVRGCDLGTITAPTPGRPESVQKLAVLDPGFQHTACKESAITLM